MLSPHQLAEAQASLADVGVLRAELQLCRRQLATAQERLAAGGSEGDAAARAAADRKRVSELERTVDTLQRSSRAADLEVRKIRAKLQEQSILEEQVSSGVAVWLCCGIAR